MSAEIEATFAVALHDAGQPVPAGLTCWTGVVPSARFALYRNNVRAGLIRALADRFAAVEKIVGEAFFIALAGAFIAARPPRSPVLIDYGDDFPDFIAGFAPAESVPYLADVARIEAARARACHAPDAPSLPLAAFQQRLTGDLAGLKVVLHPSATIISSPFPAVTIWAMNAGQQPVQPIELWTAESALILRPDLTVLVHRLPSGGALFLQQLAEGADLADAITAVTFKISDFDLEQNLILLLQSKVVVDLL